MAAPLPLRLFAAWRVEAFFFQKSLQHSSLVAIGVLGGHRVRPVMVGMWSVMLVCVHCERLCLHLQSDFQLPSWTT